MRIGDFWIWLGKLVSRAERPQLRAATADLGRIFAASVLRSFDLSRSPDGSPFAPVARGGKPLIKTGRLRRDAYFSAAQITLGNDGFFVEMGEPFYAGFQHFGTGTITARPFFGLDDQAVEEAAKILTDDAVRFVIDGRDA